MQTLFILVQKSDQAEIQTYSGVPERLELPNGDCVFGATEDWENAEFFLLKREKAPLPITQDDLFVLAKECRWNREQAGFSISNFFVATDDRSKLLLLGAKALAAENAEYTTMWTQPNGTAVELKAGQIIAIAHAVATYVDACFKIYSDVAEKIISGDISTLSQVREAFKG